MSRLLRVVGLAGVLSAAVPWLAVQAHAGAPSPRQVEKARALLGSGSPKVRIKAAQILGQANPPDALRVLSPLLKDRDALVRAAACDVLADAGDVAALPWLEEALQDEDALVQKRARAAVQGLRGVAARSAVHVPVVKVPEGVAADMGSNVHAAVLGAFGKAGRKASVETGGRWMVQVTVHPPVVRASKAETVVQVGASATVLELPGRQLRFSARVEAAAAVDGDASDKLRAELAQDAALEAARNLTADVQEWLSQPGR